MLLFCFCGSLNRWMDVEILWWMPGRTDEALVLSCSLACLSSGHRAQMLFLDSAGAFLPSAPFTTAAFLSLPTSFVALPSALGIFRASHVAEVAVTRRSWDLTTLQSSAVTTLTCVFIFGRLAASLVLKQTFWAFFAGMFRVLVYLDRWSSGISGIFVAYTFNLDVIVSMWGILIEFFLKMQKSTRLETCDGTHGCRD